jgi:hypothetical protein
MLLAAVGVGFVMFEAGLQLGLTLSAYRLYLAVRHQPIQR